MLPIIDFLRKIVNGDDINGILKFTCQFTTSSNHEIEDRLITIPIILTAIALTAITNYLNNSGISYSKTIAGDRSSGGGVVGAIVFQECDRGSQAMTSRSQCDSDRLEQRLFCKFRPWCLTGAKKKLMNQTFEIDDGLRPEYDFTQLPVAARGQGRKRSTLTVQLDRDVAELFPDSGAVNEGLRLLMRLIQKAPAQASAQSLIASKET